MNEIKIINISQVKCYLLDGIHPIRLEMGENGRLLFIYDKKETKNVFKKWVNQKYDLSIFHNEV